MSTISFSINDESESAKDAEGILDTSGFSSFKQNSDGAIISINSDISKHAVEFESFTRSKPHWVDKLIYPKFFTHMYNSDGRQYYTTKPCILPCLALSVATIFVLTAFLYPLTVNEFTSCQFERSSLSNDIGLYREIP